MANKVEFFEKLPHFSSFIDLHAQQQYIIVPSYFFSILIIDLLSFAFFFIKGILTGKMQYQRDFNVHFPDWQIYLTIFKIFMEIQIDKLFVLCV